MIYFSTPEAKSYFFHFQLKINRREYNPAFFRIAASDCRWNKILINHPHQKSDLNVIVTCQTTIVPIMNRISDFFIHLNWFCFQSYVNRTRRFLFSHKGVYPKEATCFDVRFVVSKEVKGTRGLFWFDESKNPGGPMKNINTAQSP